jgi:hypothetical protein
MQSLLPVGSFLDVGRGEGRCRIDFSVCQEEFARSEGTRSIQVGAVRIVITPSRHRKKRTG